MIEPQRLDAVGKTLAGINQFMQLLNNRHLNGIGLAITTGIFIAGAEEVGIKNRGDAVFAQQNERIGQRFEPRFDGSLQRLQGLSVMVGHQRNGMKRVAFNQRAAKNLAHIVVAPLT